MLFFLQTQVGYLPTYWVSFIYSKWTVHLSFIQSDTIEFTDNTMYDDLEVVAGGRSGVSFIYAASYEGGIGEIFYFILSK